MAEHIDRFGAKLRRGGPVTDFVAPNHEMEPTPAARDAMAGEDRSDKLLRLAAAGSLAGLLAGLLVAIPATAGAHAIMVASYHPTSLDLAKLSFCGHLEPGSCPPPTPDFWTEVMPVFGFGMAATLLAGATLGAIFVLIRSRLPGPGLVWAPIFGGLLALPTLIDDGSFGNGPWEAAFSFVTYPGMATEISRWILVVPVVAAAVAIGVFVHVLDARLPRSGGVASWVYGSLTVLSFLGLPPLLLTSGFVNLSS